MGRPKGAANAITKQVRQIVLDCFDGMGGLPAFIEWGKANPTEFYKIFSRMLPAEAKGDLDGNSQLVVNILQYGSLQQPQMKVIENGNSGKACENAQTIGYTELGSQAAERPEGQDGEIRAQNECERQG